MGTQIKKTVSGPLTANEDGMPAVTFDFPDDSQIVAEFGKLPEEVQIRLGVHGLAQKLGDSFSGAGKEENPLGYAKRRVSEVLAQLTAGDWRVTGEGGTRASLLARALSRVHGSDVEDCINVIDGMDDEAKKKLRKDPRIVQATADIKLEDAQAAKERAGKTTTDEAATVDLGSLFE